MCGVLDPNFKKLTGNLCQLMFLFPLDNHGHRTAVRAALASDPNWISSYLSKILPMIAKQVRGLGGGGGGASKRTGSNWGSTRALPNDSF